LTFGLITFSEQYEILVFYTRTDTGQNISGATIRVETTTPSGLPNPLVENVSGGYRVVLSPQKAANWTLNIYASRDNYEESSTEFRLEVKRLQISVKFISELNAIENTQFNVTIKLTEFGTNNTIDDAIVTFRFSVSRSGLFREMQPTSAPGEYTTMLSTQLYANSVYIIEIYVEKENYILPQIVNEVFRIYENFFERNALTITASSGVGGFLVVFFVALRIYSGRKRKQLDVDLANKRRFDDVDNLIGVIVLHKKSGIPVYSKIPKGGFDEGIVAAFISAITHFREEFEMFDEEQMQVIPISDIIRAVQTRNLICAFVTVKSASIEQNRKMEAYAMQVGTYLDDIIEDQPSSIMDKRITEMLDYIFDTTMDGHLLEFYKLSTSEAFPKRYRLLEKLMTDIELKHCSKPVFLAQGVATYGVTQARGCTLVLEAIELDLIHPCEEHELDTTEIEFKEYFRGSEETENT
jgi:hypothetical protein